MYNETYITNYYRSLRGACYAYWILCDVYQIIKHSLFKLLLNSEYDFKSKKNKNVQINNTYILFILKKRI